MVSVGIANEFEEENNRLDRMTPAERLSYIYDFVTFYKQTRGFEGNSTEELLNRILLITKRYKK